MIFYIQGVPEKIAQSLRTAVLQPYATELCRFQQKKFRKKIFAQIYNAVCV